MIIFLTNLQYLLADKSWFVVKHHVKSSQTFYSSVFVEMKFSREKDSHASRTCEVSISNILGSLSKKETLIFFS